MDKTYSVFSPVKTMSAIEGNKKQDDKQNVNKEKTNRRKSSKTVRGRIDPLEDVLVQDAFETTGGKFVRDVPLPDYEEIPAEKSRKHRYPQPDKAPPGHRYKPGKKTLREI